MGKGDRTHPSTLPKYIDNKDEDKRLGNVYFLSTVRGLKSFEFDAKESADMGIDVGGMLVQGLQAIDSENPETPIVDYLPKLSLWLEKVIGKFKGKEAIVMRYKVVLQNGDFRTGLSKELYL